MQYFGRRPARDSSIRFWEAKLVARETRGAKSTNPFNGDLSQKSLS